MTRALKEQTGVMSRYPLLDVTEPDEDTSRAAALTICDRATGADDARALLEMCGLLPYQRGEFQTYQFGRRRPAS